MPRKFAVILLVASLLTACGSATPTSTASAKPTATPTTTPTPAPTALRVSTAGVDIYLVITDAALVAPTTTALQHQGLTVTLVTGPPVASAISCSNSAGSFVVWNDGTATSKASAAAFCRNAGLT